MADLSQLSDEQLSVYRDMLAAKQGPKPTLSQSAQSDVTARGGGAVPPVSAPSVPMKYSGAGIGSLANLRTGGKYGKLLEAPPEMSTPMFASGSVAKAVIPTLAAYGTGKGMEALHAPDWASTLAAMAAGGLAHGGGRLATVAGDRFPDITPDDPLGIRQPVTDPRRAQAIKSLVNSIPVFGPKLTAAHEALNAGIEPYKSAVVDLPKPVPNNPNRGPSFGSRAWGNRPTPTSEPPVEVEKPAPYKSQTPGRMARANGNYPREYGEPPSNQFRAGNGPPPVTQGEGAKVTPYKSPVVKPITKYPGPEPTKYGQGPMARTVGTSAEMMRQQRIAADRLREAGIYQK